MIARLAVFTYSISGRDVILVGGGLFLLAKATHEIHNSLEGTEESGHTVVAAGLGSCFRLRCWILCFHWIQSSRQSAWSIRFLLWRLSSFWQLVMLMAAHAIRDFVDAHPTIKILALSCLLLVGVTLMAEGFDVRVPKGYIYFSMAFSVTVEMLNIRMRKKRRAPVKLYKHIPG